MREGRGEPGARVARCKVIQPRPIPALREKAAHRDRLPPPHTDSRKWGERRGAPSSQPPPLSKTQPALPKQQESRQLQAGRLGGQHPQHARPSNSLVPQTCPRSRVQGSSPPPAPPPQAPRALPSLPVRKKASTSESAAPPSSAAPSGGFMTGGGRPRVAGGRPSPGPRAALWAEGAGLWTPGFEGGRPGRLGWGRGRRGSLRRRRTAGWGRLPRAPPWSPFPGGRWPPAVCPGRGPSCLGARSPSAAAAGSPSRPSACLYCSALLRSPLYFSSSLPPSLSLYLLPPSLYRPHALSLPPSLALWLPLWLPPPPPPPPRSSSPGSRSSVPANNAQGSAELN